MAEPVTVTLSFWVPPTYVEADGEDQEAALPEPDEVSEGDAPGFFAAAPGRLLPYSEQDGGVLITCGEMTAGFADTLLWLAPSLCLTAVDKVLDSGTATFALFGSDTAITLQRDGETIAITADIMDPATFPAMPLLRALAAAGQRLVGLVETLWPNDAQAKTNLPGLRARAEATNARVLT